MATAFKVALGEMGPVQLLWLATLVSWLFLTLTTLLRGQFAEALRSGWSRAAWAGVLNPFAYYLILFAAYDRLPGQEAMALNYTWAITMSLLAVPILKQKLAPGDLLASLIAYSGVWTIATRGKVTQVEFANSSGVALALVSTILWALYWLFNARDPRAPLVAQWQNFSVALPLLTFLALLGPGLEWPGQKGFVAGVYVGLCEMGIAFVLWQTATRTISQTSKVANLIFLSPPVSLLLLHLVVGEELRGSTLAGLALILAGLALQTVFNRRRRKVF